MGEQVVLNAWLNKYKKEKYISVYNNLQTKYDTAMTTLFSDIEERSNKYKEDLAVEYSTRYNYEEVDPSDIFETIEWEAYTFYEAEKLMEYNFHFSLLATVYQIFEQQLRSFIYSELNHRLSPIRTE